MDGPKRGRSVWLAFAYPVLVASSNDLEGVIEWEAECVEMLPLLELGVADG